MALKMPVLRKVDMAKATEFYFGFLGFSIDWENRGALNLPLSMQVSRGHVVRDISVPHRDATPGAAAFIPAVDCHSRQKMKGRSRAENQPGARS